MSDTGGRMGVGRAGKGADVMVGASGEGVDMGAGGRNGVGVMAGTDVVCIGTTGTLGL
jgi:hypothetical protein